MYLNSLDPKTNKQTYETCTIINLVLQMKKLRLRKVNKLALGHIARKVAEPELKPSLSYARA